MWKVASGAVGLCFERSIRAVLSRSLVIPEKPWPVLLVPRYSLGGGSRLLLSELGQNKSKGRWVCRGVTTLPGLLLQVELWAPGKLLPIELLDPHLCCSEGPHLLPLPPLGFFHLSNVNKNEHWLSQNCYRPPEIARCNLPSGFQCSPRTLETCSFSCLPVPEWALLGNAALNVRGWGGVCCAARHKLCCKRAPGT